MRSYHLILAALLLGNSKTAAARKNKYIAPGATWYDTDGNVLSAHAGGVVKTNGTWYWFGQNERLEDKDLFSGKGKYHTSLSSLTTSEGINVYSSSDLLNWKNEGRALSPVPGTDIGPDKVVERPKAVFNEPTQTWILWFHADNSTYGQLRQGVATSPNVTGPYTFKETFQPLGGPSQDLGLFQDVDGSAYALYSNGDADADHDNLITRLNANYTNVEEVVYTFYNFDLEAPNILYTGKRYYILMSHKTGYRPNNVVVFSAEKLAGPWSVQSYIATLGTRTWNSQSTFTLEAGEKHKTYIYCGDQWATGATLYDSRYVWLPANIDDQTGSFNVEWHDLYAVDVQTGHVTIPKGQAYEAEHGTITGTDAYVTLCPTCSGSQIVTGSEYQLPEIVPAKDGAEFTIKNIVGTGQPQWVSVYYHDPDGLWGDNRNGVSVLSRTATYSVNGGVPVSMIQRSGSAGIILSQPLNVTFNAGGENSLTFSGFNGVRSDRPVLDMATELIDERVSVKQCKLAVKALHTHETKKQEKLQETELLPGKEPNLWLNVTVKKIPSGHKFKPVKIPIAHPLIDPRTTSICLITKDPQREYKDLLEAQNIKFISRVVGIEKLKGKFKPFEARRILLKENGLFLADERIIPLLPKLLGAKWFEAKKQPIPVCLKRKDLKGELERAVSSTYMNQNQGTCTSVKFAILSHTPKQILANLQLALPAIAKHITGGWDNIQALHIKTNSSASLPIWSCSLDESEGGRWAAKAIASELDSHDSDEETSEVVVKQGEKDKGKKRVQEEEHVQKPKKKLKGVTGEALAASAAPTGVSPTATSTSSTKSKKRKSEPPTTAGSPSAPTPQKSTKKAAVSVEPATPQADASKTPSKKKGPTKVLLNPVLTASSPAAAESKVQKTKKATKAPADTPKATPLTKDELKLKRSAAPGEKKKSKVNMIGAKSAKDRIIGKKVAQ
ncbi:hypothetical protein DXG01_003473 [Tephrocybe rancida]|nr:hypothetical protein DXG01_003473 [Tephrocybe rancida]